MPTYISINLEKHLMIIYFKSERKELNDVCSIYSSVISLKI